MQAFQKVRDYTLQLCERLEPEDHLVQPHPFVSPPKWHLGHTTWFFETFCLRRFFNMDLFDARFPYVFNSYYNSQGDHIPQERRGTLSRPTLKEVHAYRAHVDQRMLEAEITIRGRSDETEWRRIVEIGIQHEQQHQELLAMDIKSILFHQPKHPAYASKDPIQEPITHDSWMTIKAGTYSVGAGREGFSFDNEHERHEVLLREFHIRQQLVTNGEYLDFINDGGYRDSSLWLDEGWRWVQENRVAHPLYWLNFSGSAWQEYTLRGLHSLNLKAPVAHVSYFEADAFARWKGLRLPTEFEWEAAFGSEPRPATLWQWTQSAYLPYPGFKPLAGALGEYNAKFMSGQMVLRGGCAHTPPAHYRPTYRNFYHPEMRWQYSGIRLAQ